VNGKWVVISGIFLIVLSISSFFIFTSGIKIVQIGGFFDGTGIDTQDGMATDIFIKNDIGYLVDGSDGLEILDVSDPSDIQELGQIHNDVGSLYPRKIFVSENIAYLAVNYNGLKLIDVSDPNNPTVIGLYENNCSILDVIVSEDVAFVAAGGNGVEILNISNPSNIMQISNYTDNYNITWSLDFNEQQNLYVADRFDGIEILDVSNLSSPVELGQLKLDSAIEIDVVGSYAYISLYDNGLSIVDVSDPSDPVEISRFEDRLIKDVFVNGTSCYLVTDHGLFLLDVSDPVNPVFNNAYTYQNSAGGVFINANLIYYANGYAGLEILQIKPTNLNYYLAGFLIVPGLIMVYFGVKLLGKLDEETKYMEKIVRNY
ncbi:MAG: LVIVD repeat-containing protein, partial [Promethearchaeota archaeon]